VTQGKDKKQACVAQIVVNLDIGGLERVVIGLLRRLDRARFRSVLYCLREGGALIDEAAAAGAAVCPLNKKEGVDYRLFVRLARSLKTQGVDIVHCHNFGPLIYGSVSGRMARTAGVVYTAHGRYSSSRLGRVFFRRSWLVDRIVTVSDDARDVAINKGGVRPDRVVTLINGIDVERFAGADGERLLASGATKFCARRRELGIPEDAFVFGIVARLTAVKDHRNLFEAMVRLRRDHPAAHLCVVGDGELSDELKARAAELELGNAVSFMGARRDVPQLLNTFDAFVLSSYSEGLSITLLEAMAAGLPVVATDVGGNPEVVIDDVTGFIVRPRDPDALAGAMKAVMDDPDEAAGMGERGSDRVKRKFSLDVMVRGYEQIYEELLRSDGTAPESTGDYELVSE
jgi:sugar transferase (PEP-CTERM/EpsH1 system associated)